MKTEKTIPFVPHSNERIIARARYCENMRKIGYHVGGVPVMCQNGCGALVLVEDLVDFDRYIRRELFCTECKERMFNELPEDKQKKLEHVNRYFAEKLFSAKTAGELNALIRELDEVIARRPPAQPPQQQTFKSQTL